MRRLRSAFTALTRASNRDLLRRFRRDQSGSYLIITGLLMPVLVGFTGLGTDAGLWLYKHRAMQSAADSAAFSAATAYVNDVKTLAGLDSQAKGVTPSYGFTHGANGVDVTVIWPHIAGPGAVEVIVAQPQTPLFAGLFLNEFVVRARAVALGTPKKAGTGCVLALNKSAAGAVTTQGSSNVALTGCSLASNSSSSSALTIGGSAQIHALSVSVVGGIQGSTSQIVTPPGGISTGAGATDDPYAGATMCAVGQTPCPPTPCNLSDQTFQTAVTIGPPRQTPPPSVPPSYVLCGPTKLNSGAVVTLTHGIYYFEEDSSGKAGNLTVNGGATLQTYDAIDHSYCVQYDCGVTLVFTSRTGTNYGTASINGGAVVKLQAPISGPTKGIVVFGDRNTPTSTSFQFNGGSTQIFNGAIYVPTGKVTFSGGSSTSDACTQLVANMVTFTGNANFKIGCSNGMEEIGSIPASVKLIQ
jgi:hypothetical protein